MSFKLDLEFGQIYEKKLVELLPNESYVIKQGYFPDYDVELVNNGVTYKYECKADRYAYKTQQMALECECNKKPSGISTTKADYYAYYVIKPYNLFELYVIPVNVLKECITEHKYKRIVYGGDKLASKLYILNLSLFESYKINNIKNY
jgi:hypothetical protein